MIKLFISHASEDKPEFVRPLAEKLKAANFDVWLDEYKLKGGDSLRKEIDAALRSCDYGIVVVSPDFIAKVWAERELAGLFALETKERKIIIPIWRNVGVQEVTEYSPILADRVAISAGEDLDEIVHQIKIAVTPLDTYKSLPKTPWQEKYRDLINDISHKRSAASRFDSRDGVEQVHEAVRIAFEDAKAKVQKMNDQSPDDLRMVIVKDEPNALTIAGPYLGYSNSIQAQLKLILRFHAYYEFTNSLRGCKFGFDIIRSGEYEERTKRGRLEAANLTPNFDRELNVYWELADTPFGDGAAVIDYAFERFAEHNKTWFAKADFS